MCEKEHERESKACTCKAAMEAAREAWEAAREAREAAREAWEARDACPIHGKA